MEGSASWTPSGPANQMVFSAFRAWWIARAQATFARGTYKGLWIDDVNMNFLIADNTDVELVAAGIVENPFRVFGVDVCVGVDGVEVLVEEAVRVPGGSGVEVSREDGPAIKVVAEPLPGCGVGGGGVDVHRGSFEVLEVYMAGAGGLRPCRSYCEQHGS